MLALNRINNLAEQNRRKRSEERKPRASETIGWLDEWSYAGDHDFVFRRDLANGVRFRPTIDGDAIVFGIVPAPGMPLTPFSYARVHASFAELLLSQADDSFDSAELTARFCEYDHPE